MKKRAPYRCAYQRSNEYNHGGCLPCGLCAGCLAETAAAERCRRWNEATNKGASPTR